MLLALFAQKNYSTYKQQKFKTYFLQGQLNTAFNQLRLSDDRSKEKK